MDSESTFLQLLVAQLKNQDPTQPQDGTQFVSELAQFSSVQQELQMTQDLNSINSILSADANGTTGSQGASSSGTSQSGGTPATTQS
jgi:flagellar basal-body rod modification protein FlgD